MVLFPPFVLHICHTILGIATFLFWKHWFVHSNGTCIWWHVFHATTKYSVCVLVLCGSAICIDIRFEIHDVREYKRALTIYLTYQLTHIVYNILSIWKFRNHGGIRWVDMSDINVISIENSTYGGVIHIFLRICFVGTNIAGWLPRNIQIIVSYNLVVWD